VNLSETSDAYRVTADLPGMRREDVQINAEGDQLIISGSRTETTDGDDDGRSYLCRECVTGEFRRVVSLEDADIGRARATMNDGVLTIEVPKTAESSRRRRSIPIESSSGSSSSSSRSLPGSSSSSRSGSGTSGSSSRSTSGTPGSSRESFGTSSSRSGSKNS
jgi:HSP20 family molecular chaperone IbpA